MLGLFDTIEKSKQAQTRESASGSCQPDFSQESPSTEAVVELPIPEALNPKPYFLGFRVYSGTWPCRDPTSAFWLNFKAPQHVHLNPEPFGKP